MTIENGQVANADDVTNALGTILHNQAQTIFEQAVDGFSNKINFPYTGSRFLNLNYNILTSRLSPTQNNLFYSTDDYYTTNPQGTNVTLTNEFSQSVNYPGYTVYDLFDDSSIDSSLWDTTTAGNATVSEDTEKISLVSNTLDTSIGTLTTKGDLWSEIAPMDIFILYVSKAEFASLPAGDPSRCKLRIHDGSNEEVIWESSSSPNVGAGQLLLQKVGDIVYWQWTGSQTANVSYTPSGSVDISGWSDFKVEAYVKGSDGGNNSYIDLNWSYYNTTGNIHQLTTNGKEPNVPAVITNAYLISNASISGTSGYTFQKYELTADSGLNWEEVTPNQIHHFTNTGSYAMARITTSGAACPTINGSNAVIFSDYAVYFNIY